MHRQLRHCIKNPDIQDIVEDYCETTIVAFTGCIVSFSDTEPYLYKTVNTKMSCPHVSDTVHKFCPECGVKVQVLERKRVMIQDFKKGNARSVYTFQGEDTAILIDKDHDRILLAADGFDFHVTENGEFHQMTKPSGRDITVYHQMLIALGFPYEVEVEDHLVVHIIQV